MGFSEQIKSSVNGDEYYTPQNAVDMILPLIKENMLRFIRGDIYANV